MEAKKFSNFAKELAKLYKSSEYSQKKLISLFNEIYDIVQGTTVKPGELSFEEVDTAPKTLKEAIKRTLNIDYNGTDGNNDVAGRDKGSEAGRQGSPETSSGREPAPAGAGATERGGRAEKDSRAVGAANGIESQGASESGTLAFVGVATDRQGNPIDPEGKLIVDQVKSIDEISDDDFNAPTRSVQLPDLPQKVSDVIGANGRPIIIKKNIFARNKERHGDVTPADGRIILKAALYTPNLYGQTQARRQPYKYVLVNIPTEGGKYRHVLLEVEPTKENIEIVHWYYLDEKGLNKLKKQAAREDGQLLILPSEKSKEVGALSDPTSDKLSSGKGSDFSGDTQGKSQKSEAGETPGRETPGPADSGGASHKYASPEDADSEAQEPRARRRATQPMPSLFDAAKEEVENGGLPGLIENEDPGAANTTAEIQTDVKPATEGYRNMTSEEKAERLAEISQEHQQAMHEVVEDTSAKKVERTVAYLADLWEQAVWMYGEKPEDLEASYTIASLENDIRRLRRYLYQQAMEGSKQTGKEVYVDTKGRATHYESVLKKDAAGQTSKKESATAKQKPKEEPDPLLQRKKGKLGKGEFCNVERVFRLNGNFNFTGRDKIESTDDVAYIFRQLENASVENTFAVFVVDGKPIVLHLSIGGFSSAPVEVGAIKVAYDRLKPQKVYFVHNHPNGALTASIEDKKIVNKIGQSLGVETEGIIIDTTSGKYVKFTGSSREEVKDNGTVGGDAPLRVYSFDTQEYDRDAPVSESLSSSQAVASFLSTQRLGKRPKISALVLSLSLHVTANIHLPITDLDQASIEKIASSLASSAVTFGGSGVILYGDFPAGIAYTEFSALKSELKKSNITLFDAIRVDGMYSASDNGYEMRPKRKNYLSERKISEVSNQEADEETSKMVTALAEAFGHRVLFDGDFTGERHAGYMEDGVLHINPALSGSKQLAFVIGHELTHAAEGTQAYAGLADMLQGSRVFRQWVARNYGGGIDAAIAAIKARYAQEGPSFSLSDKGALEEMIANFISEEVLTDRRRLAELLNRAQGLRSVVRRIIDALRSLAERIGLKGTKARELRIAMSMLERALEESQSMAVDELLGTRKNLILGEKGAEALDASQDATMRMESLRVAREMERPKTLEDIKAGVLRIFKGAIEGSIKGKSVEIGRISEKGRVFLEKVSGLKMKPEISFMLNPSDLIHINNEHFGENEKDPGQNIPLTEDDISNMAEIIHTPDHVVFVEDKDGRNMFIFLKADPVSGCLNLAEVYADRRGNLTAKSLYKTKKDVTHRVMALESQLSTSAANGAILSSANVENLFDMTKGFSAKAIKMATGWERGADGKWRYEVADGKLKVDLVDDMLGGRRFWKLGDVWEDEALFAAYPELRDMRVTGGISLNGDSSGSYSPGKGIALEINAETSRNESLTGKLLRELMVHEIQHAVQEIEGFAKGGSASTARDYIKEHRERAVEAIERGLNERVEAARPAWDEVRRINSLEWNDDNWSEREAELAKAEAEAARHDETVARWRKFLEAAKRRAWSEISDEEAQEVYRNIAGEVEARNAARRRDFSDKERSERLLSETEDVAREDQIFLRDNLGESAYIGRKARAQYEALLEKKRPDMPEAERKAALDYLHSLEDTKENNRKVKIAVHWLSSSDEVNLPNDMHVIDRAIASADRKGKDAMAYRTPQELLRELGDVKEKEKRINPDTVPTLRRAHEVPEHGIVVYDVEESQESREAMRRIINTHWGEDANPWCLLQGDGKGNLTERSAHYWEHYSSVPKQVAFKNGRLLAFRGYDGRVEEGEDVYSTIKATWWDRQDENHVGVPMVAKEADGWNVNSELNPTNGNMMEDIEEKRWRGEKGKPGTYEEYSENTHRIETLDADGKKHGLQLVENADTRTEDEYDHGVHKSMRYYINDTLVEEENYDNGVLREKTRYNLDGTLRQRDVYLGFMDDMVKEEYDNFGKTVKLLSYSTGFTPIVQAYFMPDGTLGSVSAGGVDVTYDMEVGVRSYGMDNAIVEVYADGSMKGLGKNRYGYYTIELTEAQSREIVERAEAKIAAAVDSLPPKLREVYEQQVGQALESDGLRFRDAEEGYTDEELQIIEKAKADGTYMKAPNGKPTNLTEKQWAQVRTKAFKEWFGDWENDPENASRMVDENGEPKVFYHGTDADFTVFDESYNGSSTDAGWLGDGFYFYGIQDEARFYGDKNLEVFLNIRDPYYASTEENMNLAESNSREESEAFREQVEDEGHDGVYYNGDLREEVVAFRPNQIKSATENDGSFSKAEDDIRYRGVNANTRAMLIDFENDTVKPTTREEVQAIVDEEQVYMENPAPVVFFMSEAELVEEARKQGDSEEEISKVLEYIREVEDGKSKMLGGYSEESKDIIIFAWKIDDIDQLRLTLQHEELHHIIDTEGLIPSINLLAEELKSIYPTRAERIKRLYRMKPGHWSEEMVVTIIEEGIEKNRLWSLESKLSDEGKNILLTLLKSIGYGKEGHLRHNKVGYRKPSALRLLERGEEKNGRGDGGRSASLRRKAEGSREKADLQELTDTAEQLVRDLGVEVEIVTDTESITHADSRTQRRMRRSKGWYDPKTGKVVIVLPNNTSVADVEATVLHEIVGHKGLRAVVGDKRFNDFIDRIFRGADPKTRAAIIELAKKHNWDFREATEEYIARMAESGAFRRSEARNFWEKVKRFFTDLMHEARIRLGYRVGDADLAYMLWRSYQMMRQKGPLAEADNVMMKYRLGVGDFAETRFRDPDPEPRKVKEARDTYEKRVASTLYQMKEALQDSMLALKEAMQTILPGANIEDVDGYENPYLGENRLSSVTDQECKAMKRLLIEPLLQEAARLMKQDKKKKSKLTPFWKKNKTPFWKRDERLNLLTDYMMAKHGLERNVVMAERDAERSMADTPEKAALDAAQAAYNANPADPALQAALAAAQTAYDAALQALVAENRKRDYAGLTALTGMDDVADAEAEAQRMVKVYERRHDTTDLWNKVRAVSEAILSKSHDCGMMSDETYQKVKAMYTYYIPLRGFDETTSEDVYAYLQHSESPFNAPIKTAGGRSSKADNPFAYLSSMLESVVASGNRNTLVKQRMLNFVQNHPSDLVSVSELWLMKNGAKRKWEPVFPDNIDPADDGATVEQKMRDFEQRMQQLAAAEPKKYKRSRDAKDIPYRVVDERNMHQHQVVVKRGGRDIVLTINGNPRLAQALNGMTNPHASGNGLAETAQRFLESCMRFMSGVFTTYNPDFMISNFMRDMQYTNTVVWAKENPKYAARFNKNCTLYNPLKMRALLSRERHGRLDMGNRTDRLFAMFLANGGETGYTALREIRLHKKKIFRELRLQAGGKVSLNKGLHAFGVLYEEFNRSIELCARFTAFVTSIEEGRTIDRAIWDAKEISVNFNKKGAGGTFFRAQGQTFMGNVGAALGAYGRHALVFFNASVQGLTNFGRVALKHPFKTVPLVAHLVVLGMVSAMLGAYGDDDDEEEGKKERAGYFDLPPYVRRSNMCISLGGDTWLTMPLGQEYRCFYGMGELAVSALSGKEKYTKGELTMEMLAQMSQMMPVDLLEGSGGLYNFMPTAIRPLWDVHENLSWTGLPIYNDNDEQAPEWTKAFSSTNKDIVGLCEALNEAAGGNKYDSKWTDINPAKIDYLLKGYFGGIYTTADRVTKIGEALLGQLELQPRNIPIVNRLVKITDERMEDRHIKNEYYRAKEERDHVKYLLRNYKRDTDAGVEDFTDEIQELEASPKYLRMEIFDDYARDINSLQKEIDDPDISEQVRKEFERDLLELKREMLREMEATRTNKDKKDETDKPDKQ